MKAPVTLSVATLLVLCTCALFSQTAKYATSQPYTLAQGYFITDSTAVRSTDSLTTFAPLPESFCETAKLVTKLEPYFPKDLLGAQVEGDLIAAGYIDSTGVVRKAEVLSSTERRFNKHALYALIQWRFNPLNTTNVWIKVPFRFRIMNSN